jgi:predicted nucleotidyltransferase
MTFGLNPQEFELLNRLVLLPLKNAGLSVYVFGSRAVGKHHKFSDIDLLWENTSQRELSKGFIEGIKEKIEDSKFPIKVDLVESTRLAASYRETVEKQKVRI